MKTNSIAALIVFCAATTAWAGYGEMKKEFNEYTPPVFHKPTKSNPETGTSVEKIGARWEKAVAEQARLTQIGSEKFRKIASNDNSTADFFRYKFTLDDFKILALLRNPGVKAAEYKLRAAIDRYGQVSNLDDVLKRYATFTEGVMPGVGPMKGTDSPKMKFPFPGVSSLKGEIVTKNVEAARETLEAARRDIAAEAAKTYWNLVFVIKAAKITEQTSALFLRLESVAETRYRAGKTSFQDVVRVRIKNRMITENLNTLREKRRNLETKVLTILNLDPNIRLASPELRNPGTKFPEPEFLYQQALKNSQELGKMRAMIGKTERMTEMAETMILPPYTLNFSIFEDAALSMKPSFPDKVEIQRGAGLPRSPWYGANDAWLGETRKNLEARRNELENMETMTVMKVRRAWFELDKARRELKLYEDTVVSLSKSALDVSTRGYESGAVSFTDVIGSHTNWLRVNLSMERKRSDIGVARAELERAVGGSLEK